MSELISQQCINNVLKKDGWTNELREFNKLSSYTGNNCNKRFVYLSHLILRTKICLCYGTYPDINTYVLIYPIPLMLNPVHHQYKISHAQTFLLLFDFAVTVLSQDVIGLQCPGRYLHHGYATMCETESAAADPAEVQSCLTKAIADTSFTCNTNDACMVSTCTLYVW